MDDEISAAPASSTTGAGYSPIVHRLEEALLPAWLRPTRGENWLPVVAAIVLAVVLQLVLHRRFTLLPLHWLLPVLELALLASLTVINPVRLPGTLGWVATSALHCWRSSRWTTGSARCCWTAS